MFKVRKWKSSGWDENGELSCLGEAAVVIPKIKKKGKKRKINSLSPAVDKPSNVKLNENERSGEKKMKTVPASIGTVEVMKTRKPNKRNKYRTMSTAPTEQVVEVISSDLSNNPTVSTVKEVKRKRNKKNKYKHLIKQQNSNNVNETGDDLQEDQSEFRMKMTEKLKSAQFRFLNEKLYTMTGDEAAKMFEEDRDTFQIYHKGFQAQVEHWPENPLNLIIKQLRKLPSGKVIADFGCGDAELARQLRNKHTCHSFDLVALNHRVTACNMSQVPLEDEGCDIVVFCLSLMGTNLGDYILEAARILKPGGCMKVAEVKSRIENLKKFIKSIEKCGFSIEKQKCDNQMFILLTFIRTDTSPSPCNIVLKPCLYKKR